MIPKPKKVKSKSYCAWIRKRKCALCNSSPCDGHHLVNPDHGTRRSRDDLQVPVCRRCHRWLHDNPIQEKILMASFYRLAQVYWQTFEEIM